MKKIKCAKEGCITILRKGKKEGDYCDCCYNGGKEPIFLDRQSYCRVRSGGGSIVRASISYNGS